MKDSNGFASAAAHSPLLNVLVQNGGQFVPDDVLMAKAWPSTSVEESNLRVQMTALRRLLDDGTREQSHITNAPWPRLCLYISAGAAASRQGFVDV